MHGSTRNGHHVGKASSAGLDAQTWQKGRVRELSFNGWWIWESLTRQTGFLYSGLEIVLQTASGSPFLYFARLGFLYPYDLVAV